MKLKVYISKYTERCIISRLFRKTSSCFFCAFSVFGGIIMKEYKTPTTVREFKEFLKQFPDDAILGFSNQPVQTMIYDDRFDEKYLSFQEPTQTEIIDVNELLDQNIC